MTAVDVRESMRQAEEAERAETFYVVRTEEEAGLLRAIGVKAGCSLDRALSRDLPHGEGSRVALVDVPALAFDDEQHVQFVERIELPGCYPTLAELLNYRGRPPIDCEVDVMRVTWAAFLDKCSREKVVNRDPGGTRSRPSRRRRKTIDDLLAMPPMRWLRPELVPAVGSGFIVGRPNEGKTMFMLGLALSAFHGVEHLGARCLPSSVLLFVGEGTPGLGQRIEAWRREHAADDPGGRYLEVIDDQPALCTREGQEALYRSIKEAEEDHGHLPGIVAIDTLSSLWGGETEDKTEVAAPFMRAINRMAAELGIVFLIVHHAGKGTKGRDGKVPALTLDSLRGSSAFIGAADFVLGVETVGSQDSNRTRVTVLKQKDAERSAPLHVRVHSITLGHNEDGDRLSGAFLVPDKARQQVDDPEEDRSRKFEQMRALQTECLQVMRDLGGMTSSKSAVINLMTGKTDRKRAAFDRCVDLGQIEVRGSARERAYYLRGSTARSDKGVCDASPHTPSRGAGAMKTPTPAPHCQGATKGPRGATGQEGAA